jgi:S1-C subfamily serine protease
LHPLALGDSSNLKVGETIAAIGNPFGLSGSMTSGIVSQLGRLLPSGAGYSIPDIIQTDAAINPGNSGGPLLNMRGEIVGINTAIQSTTGEFTGVGFAIPSQTIAKIVPTLIERGEYDHPWIGISGRDIDPDLAKVLGLKDTVGFLIVTVVENSPASKAGLIGSDKIIEVEGVNYTIGGDIIVSVDGIEVRKIDDILVYLQRAKSVGDEMVLEILRDNRTTDITVILQERPNRN